MDNTADGGGKKDVTVFSKAVVVASERYLVIQIVSVVQMLFEGMGFKESLIFGGTLYARNVEDLIKKKPDVVVGVTNCCFIDYFLL